MTEEDTFNKLKRPTYEEVRVKIFEAYGAWLKDYPNNRLIDWPSVQNRIVIANGWWQEEYNKERNLRLYGQ